jgi:RNA polymerase sigma factor (sigma-70 family)
MLEKLRARDHRAQQELRRRLSPKILAVCRHMLKDEALAQEAAEDIWMDFLYEHVDQVQKERALGAYLRMMTVRRCVRIRDWQKRHEQPEDQPPLVGGSETEMVTSLDGRRQTARLEDCLKRLSRRARRIIRMRYRNEMTQEAIGKALRVSKQYIGRLIARSLEALRECMQEAA